MHLKIEKQTVVFEDVGTTTTIQLAGIITVT